MQQRKGFWSYETMLMATIPSETIPAKQVATTAGLLQRFGEIVGFAGGAWAAGRAADHFGLPVTMWIMRACALIAGMLAFLLRETAPVKTKDLAFWGSPARVDAASRRVQ